MFEPIVAPEAKTRPLPTKLEQLPQHHADVVATSAASLDAWVVQPILATEQDVEAWYADEYQALDLSDNIPAEIGEEVLWKGLKKGRGGCVSTLPEYFNGVVHNLEIVDDGLFYNVS